ncbi:pantoate--beta-alanine ligase [Bradyrhizobium zhanjiangense]|uniref:pantoate--beta-alanine ligase n=1 Tax=Bradyrhizobium zhanjiangense TaxID=1325107 RepID=UPI001FE22F6B|nr:pantoate--beta-alanine ligase [Bradyrhizobium zhanjiangense]
MNEDLSTYTPDFLQDEGTVPRRRCCVPLCAGCTGSLSESFRDLNFGRPRQPLCGAFRPGHFRGVATVVCQLLNMVQPDVLFFGQKDFQQCAVVRRMAVDLNLPIEIVTVATVRELDGFAISSRNRYLGKEERQRALAFNRGLFVALDEFRSGERLIAIANGHLETVDRLQYLELVVGDTLNARRQSNATPRGALRGDRPG